MKKDKTNKKEAGIGPFFKKSFDSGGCHSTVDPSATTYHPAAAGSNPKPENTHQREKYHCMDDLLYDWFEFDQTSKAMLILHKQSSWIQRK